MAVEVWPTISKQHALMLMQPRHSKVKVVMAEEVQAVAEETEAANMLEKHLKAMRIQLMALELAVEERNLSMTLEQVEVDHPQSWSRSAGRSSTLEKEAQSQART